MAGYFILECEAVGTSMRFLDVEFLPDGLYYGVKPFWKATNIGVPLCMRSDLSPAAKCSWPAAVTSRLAGRSSSIHYVKMDKHTLLSRYQHDFALPSTIDLVVGTHPVRKARRLEIPDMGTLRSQRPTVWMPLPFHPCLPEPITKVLHDFNDDPACNGILTPLNARAPQVRVAWKNGLPRLTSRLLRIAV